MPIGPVGLQRRYQRAKRAKRVEEPWVSCLEKLLAAVSAGIPPWKTTCTPRSVPSDRSPQRLQTSNLLSHQRHERHQQHPSRRQHQQPRWQPLLSLDPLVLQRQRLVVAPPVRPLLLRPHRLQMAALAVRRLRRRRRRAIHPSRGTAAKRLTALTCKSWR